MKYPYIAKGLNSGSIVLFYEQNKGVTLESKTWASENLQHSNCINEDLFKSITAEYLANTYGKVESKEHAEFIVKLAEANGLSAFGWYKEDGCWFNFSGGVFYFWAEYSKAKSRGEKLITIPLPPKEESMESQKEWPAVGDEVLIDLANHNVIYGHNIDGKKAVVRSIFKDGDTTVYAVSHDGACYCFVGGILKKPPTPEEKLADILTEITGYQDRKTVLSGAKAIINGEIEGLEYKHD